jgi:uncharacterized coiled-coil protein SlyX
MEKIHFYWKINMSEEKKTKQPQPIEQQEIDYLKQDMMELQIAYTHQQDHIKILDAVILELRTEMISLQNHIQMLEEKINNSNQNGSHFDIHEEKPPHY